MSEVARSKTYDAITDVVCKVLAIRNPSAAIHYRHGREQQYLYAAGVRERDKVHTMRADNKTGDELAYKYMSEVTAQCRKLVRDNPNLAGAMREMTNNIIFKGILPQAQLEDDDKNNDIEKQYKKWAKAVKLRRKSKQTVRHLWMDGGVFWCFSPSKTLHDKGVVPLNLQLLEIDHLDTSKNEVHEDGTVIKHGIEYNWEGFVVAYWLLPAHPSSSTSVKYGSLNQSKRIDARWCLLVADPERVSQSLPVSWLASMVVTMRDFEDYQGFERMAAKLTAVFSIILKDKGGDHIGGRPLNGTDVATQSTTTDLPQTPAFIRPGSITELPADKDIHTIENNRPNNAFGDYSRVNLQSASTTTGQSYETFSNDFTAASYSSVRQAISKERRSYMEQQQTLIDEAYDPLWLLWCEFAFLYGFIPEEDIPVSWQTPGWDYINPLQDANATKVLLELGLDNPIDASAGRGRNYEDNIKNAKRAKKMREEAGLEEKSDAEAA